MTTQTKTVNKYGTLHNYTTGAAIRPATKAELEESKASGPEGVIEVVIDGKPTSCYVQD